jgi:hypothetical protein
MFQRIFPPSCPLHGFHPVSSVTLQSTGQKGGLSTTADFSLKLGAAVSAGEDEMLKLLRLFPKETDKLDRVKP